MSDIKVLTFGTFDYAHPGHKYYLGEAKKLGNELVTIIARDKTIKRLRKNLPDHNENQRKKGIEDFKISNHKVLLGHPDNPYFFLPEIKPDIIALGYDQTHFTEKLSEKLKEIGLSKTKIIRLESHHPEKFKSSIIRKNKR